MLEKSFIEVYDKFKLQFYRKVFELVRERDGSLSAMEAFSLEVIKMLDNPTVGQFADFLNISQSNATYKVNSLIKKGYLERQNSQTDRREYHLVLSEKFYRYAELLTSYEMKVMERMKERFSPEDVAKLDEMLQIISDELMSECDEILALK
ncbi:MAG: MarR family transcriptional regulator [Oscillospiraceae bacterium]|nr:MarR family transcriptional regulator [Oscillospiraceae bacterium]